MGTWALDQAAALQRNGAELRVCSFTPWLPRWLGSLPIGSVASWARCPQRQTLGSIEVEYPRWPVYEKGVGRDVLRAAPQIPLNAAWAFSHRELFGILDAFRPDLLFAHHSALSGYFAMRAQQARGTPFVVAEHRFSDITECADLPLRRAHVGNVLRRAARVIAVARRMESDIRRLFPAAHTQTVHNGADPIPATMSSAERPEDLRDRDIVFCASFFYRRKNIPLLVKAFARIAGHRPRAILVIAGDGADRHAVEAAIHAASLHGRVRLLGAQPHSVVQQYMAWCDVFALPSRDEPLATAYLEAISAGKPIICCSDGGITDVIRDGVHGLVVPPGDEAATAGALDQLLGDDSARETMGRNVRLLYERGLSWDSNARTLMELFRNSVAH